MKIPRCIKLSILVSVTIYTLLFTLKMIVHTNTIMWKPSDLDRYQNLSWVDVGDDIMNGAINESDNFYPGPEVWEVDDNGTGTQRVRLNNDLVMTNTRTKQIFEYLIYCPVVPPDLVGNMTVNEKQTNATFDEVVRDNPEVQNGGKWKPSVCKARHKIAVIIPYRDRESHLILLLKYLLPILKRQQLDFRIFVVEQFGKGTFNKGRLMNAAFVEASKLHNFQCLIFHDVDLLPEDDRNMYSCSPYPVHLSFAVNQWNYILPYDHLVGGVFNLNKEIFLRVNGYSNEYWGWGAEDDDMAERITAAGLRINRPPSHLGRYKMIPHVKRTQTKEERSLIYERLPKAKSLYKDDGVKNVSYRLRFIKEERLYTHIMIDVGKSPWV